MNVRETSKYSLKPIYYTFLKMRCQDIKKTGGILFLKSPHINNNSVLSHYPNILSRDKKCRKVQAFMLQMKMSKTILMTMAKSKEQVCKMHNE